MVSPAWLTRYDPDDAEIAALIRVSGLRPFARVFFPSMKEPEREGPVRSRRPPDAQRTQWIGPYHIAMERRGENSTIKLSLYDFKQGYLKLKATWSGYGKVETDRQFLNVADFAKAAVLRRTQSQRR